MAVVFADNTTATVTSGGTTAPVAGTVETWTAGSVGGFPVSLASGDWFHVADQAPGMQSEMVRVTAISGTGPYTWTVTRGDEGTIPVAHRAGFTIQQVVTSGDLGKFSQFTGRLVYLDNYGADPTGATLSDSAWTAASAAATAAVQYPGFAGGTSGALIVLGAGIYKFSVGVVAVTDARIGIIGQGKAVTTIMTAGSGGILVQATGGAQPGGMCAPVGGFGLWGVSAGTNVTGLRYGDRNYGHLCDVDAYNFSAAGSIGIQVYSTSSSGVEGIDAASLSSRLCTVGYSFDGAGVSGSFDYSRWKLHTTGCGTALQVVNGAQGVGVWLQLSGNIGGGAAVGTPTLVVVGNSGTDTAKLEGCCLHISVEANASANDFAFDGDGSGGIINCYGEILAISNGGTFSAGPAIGSRPTFSGMVFGSPTFQGAAGGAFRPDNLQSPTFAEDVQQALTAGATIKTATDGRYAVIPVTASSNVTGIILEPPALRANFLASTVTVVNRSSFTVTFAASGSNVADGSSDVIAALTARSFTYDGNTALWYRQG